MSPEGALEELRACAGSQFDPVVVAAYERVRREDMARERERTRAES